MPHLSLYRKYRPQTFAQIVGQDHVTQTLQNAIAEQRVAHALLFSGPRGTGKTSTARVLAKALNCESGKTEPDNSCPSCIEITQGSSLDVVEIDAASHGSVDDARELREKVAYAPVGGRWKVYIIDECHMLSPAANNALLKVLEEPPEHVAFVFATTEPHKVLQTLLDRCQRYEFRAVTANDLAGHLTEVCASEGVKIDEDAISLIAGRAGGSVRDALSMLEQLMSFAGTEISFEDITRLLGSVADDILFEAVDIVSDRDAGAAFAFSDRLIRSGSDIREFVRALIDHLRALFLVQHASAAEEILDATDEQLERLRAQANRFDPGEVLRLVDLASEAHIQLRQAVDARLALEVALARMARPDLHATPASLLSRIERLERLSGIEQSGEAAHAVPPKAASADPPTSKAVPPASAKDRPKEPQKTKAAAERPAPRASAPVQPATPPSPGEIDIDKIRRAWELVLEKVKRRKISFHALLLPADPVGWQDGELVLQFGPRSRFHKDKVAEPSQHAPLVDALEEMFGVRPRIRCVVGEEAAVAKPAEPEPPDDAGTDEGQGEAGVDDVVSRLQKSLNAEVVKEK